MKKAILTILSLVLFSGYSTVASAGWNVGLSASAGVAMVTGSENLYLAANTSAQSQKETGDESADFNLGSVFVEYAFDGGGTVGIDFVPAAAEMDAKSKSKSDGGSTVTNKANAEFSDLTTVYFSAPVVGPLYVKGGYAWVDVVTLENLGTGSTYGDDQLYGGMAGIGVGHSIGSMFMRAEATYHKFETLKLTSSASNTIEADSELAQAKISIGLSF